MSYYSNLFAAVAKITLSIITSLFIFTYFFPKSKLNKEDKLNIFNFEFQVCRREALAKHFRNIRKHFANRLELIPGED